MTFKNVINISVSIYIIFSVSYSIHAENTSTDITGDIKEENKFILNAIHSEEIRAIMRRLNMLSFEREYTALELDNLRAEQVQLLVQAASELKQSAASLTHITGNKNISEADHITFSAMANELYLQTLTLQKESEANHNKALAPAYTRLHETCNACHRLFRDR